MAQLQSTGVTGSLTLPGSTTSILTNTVAGRTAFISNNTGYMNSAFGFGALKNNTSGFENSAFGYKALYLVTGDSAGARYNGAFGDFALASNTTGQRNCAFGTQALRDNNSGQNNSAFGVNALLSNSSGNRNSAFGSEALRSNITGNNNCAFGHKALYHATSNGNTAIGFGAGGTGTGTTLTTGTNNTLIGSGSRTANANSNNSVTLGDNAITALRCNVTTISAASDFRDKTEIKTITNGLNIIDQTRPVTYRWDKREWYPNGIRDGSRSDTNIQVGFIAQELKELMEKNNVNYLNLVLLDNPEKLEASPQNLFSHLVAAVQELHQKVKALEAVVYKN